MRAARGLGAAAVALALGAAAAGTAAEPGTAGGTGVAAAPGTAAASAPATASGGGPSKGRAPRIASYRIEAALDAPARTITASERIEWTNATSAATSTVCFHLYLNGFRDTDSTFIAETAGKHRRWDFFAEKDPWGAIDVTAMAVAGAPVRFTPAGAVGWAVLPAPVPPGGSVALDVKFTARLPRVFARTGFADTARGRFFMVGQWFPKVGVLGDSGWACDDFHASTEFFSDFGTYDVALDVPDGFVVGATGLPAAPPAPAPGAPGRTVHRFHAEDVHDFGWTAWAGFAERTRTGPGGVELRLLYPPENESFAERHLEAAAGAMEWLGAHVMPYPYARLTIVDPPFEASGAGGMEYPTLITIWSDRWMPAGAVGATVGVTVHEFSHQYFYGIFASNEPREAWLDEGMTTWATGRISDALWGEERSAFDVGVARLGYFEYTHLRYRAAAPLLDPIVLDAWRYRDLRDYGIASYARPALAMRTLEAIVGTPAIERGLAAYAARSAFRHPTTADLAAAFSAGAGQDLGWYFDALFRRTGEVDYAVGKVKSERKLRTRGIVPASGAPGSAVFEEEVELEPPVWETEIDVERRGDVALPVEVLVVFEDGTEVRGTWTREEQLAASSAWRRLTFTSDTPLVRVEVDPDRKLVLDRDWTNGGWSRDAPAARVAARAASTTALALETLFQVLGF